MIIHAYLHTWNEVELMPYLLRHYGSFCDRIIVSDDGSTDGTRGLVETCPIAELRELGANGVNDDIFLVHRNEDYKESRGVADWVILVDADEFIYRRGIRELLEYYKDQGVNLPLVQGYNMVSDGLPTTDGQIYEQICSGFPFEMESKRVVFNPHLEITYWHGLHRVQSAPEAIENPSGMPEIAMLHYTYLGLDYLYNRRLRYRSRMSQVNKQNGWGNYVFAAQESMRQDYQNALAIAHPLPILS